MPLPLPQRGESSVSAVLDALSPIQTRTDKIPSRSRSVSAVIATVVPLLAFIYFCALYGMYRYAQRNPRPLNKTSGIRLQKYGPAVYAFMVSSSLAEVAVAAWLLVQYRFNSNYPNMGAYGAVKTLLFSGCWTTLTAGMYTILFLHPSWSKYSIPSIGVQAIWILFTWFIWVVGAAVLNSALPSLLVRGSCAGLVYCEQIQGLFAFSVLEIMALTVGMLVIVWLAWQSTRDIIRAWSSR